MSGKRRAAPHEAGPVGPIEPVGPVEPVEPVPGGDPVAGGPAVRGSASDRTTAGDPSSDRSAADSSASGASSPADSSNNGSPPNSPPPADSPSPASSADPADAAHPRSRPHRRHRPPDPPIIGVWERSQQESRRFATRFAGQLLIIGASLGAILTLLLGVQQGVFSATWWNNMATSAFAAAWGLVYVLLSGPAPDLILRATPAASALLITANMAVSHSNAADGMLLLTWPVLFAAYLLPRRTAYWTLLIVIGCLTVVLKAGSGPDRFAAWVEITASVALTQLVILQVRAQADRLKKALAQQARTDPLTGLGNRRAFDEALEREAARQRRTHAPLSLLTVDVDHFKQINDTWGHSAGDETLTALGELLPRLVRAGDVVGRIGGEEFGVVMPDCPHQQAVDRADTLRSQVAAVSRTWAHPVTVSVGVATLPDSAQTMTELVIAADMALYAAKESGRDQTKSAPAGRLSGNDGRLDIP
ncbi:MAG: GGDEF domain-containing protein [Catenulispora sp.]|nr:GGDEF domain-containing protein [Catenulispora sp.]